MTANPPHDTSPGAGRLRRMLVNSFYVAMGTYATHIFSLLISIVLTRRLEKETYGVYAVLLAMYGLLTMLVSFGAQPVIQRFLPEERARGNRRGAMAITVYGALTHLAGALLIGAFCWLGRSWLADFYQIDVAVFTRALPYFVLFTIFKWEAYILEECLVAHHLHKFRNITLSLFQGLKWALYFFFLPQDGSIITVMLFLVLSNAVLLLAFVGQVLRATLNVTDATREPLPVRRMVRYGLLRYAAQATVIGFFTDIDTQLISHFRDPEQAGLYAFATRTVQMLATLVPTFFLLAVITPVYIEEYTRRKDAGQLIRVFSFYNKVITSFLAPTLIGALILTEPIIGQVFDPKFLASATAFRVFFIGSFFFYFFNSCSFLLVILEKPEYTLYSRVFAAYNVGMDLLLIPRYGIVGAAFATGSAMALGYLFTFLLIRRTVAIRIPWVATARILIYAGVMGAAIWPLKGRINGIPMLLATVALGVVVYGLLAWRLPVFNGEERQRLNSAFGRRIFPG